MNAIRPLPQQIAAGANRRERDGQRRRCRSTAAAKRIRSRVGANRAKPLSIPQSWMTPLKRTVVVSTPASSNRRPIASPSSRKMSFSHCNQCRRQAEQFFPRSIDRRQENFFARPGVGRISVEHPFHQRRRKKALPAVEGIGFPIGGGTRHGPQQHQRPNSGRMSFLGEQRRRERHVSARAVADQSHPATVEVEFRIVLGHPFHGGVNFIDRLRIFRFGATACSRRKPLRLPIRRPDRVPASGAWGSRRAPIRLRG